MPPEDDWRLVKQSARKFYSSEHDHDWLQADKYFPTPGNSDNLAGVCKVPACSWPAVISILQCNLPSGCS